MDNWVVVATIFGTFDSCEAAEDFESKCDFAHRSYEVRLLVKPEET